MVAFTTAVERLLADVLLWIFRTGWQHYGCCIPAQHRITFVAEVVVFVLQKKKKIKFKKRGIIAIVKLYLLVSLWIVTIQIKQYRMVQLLSLWMK